MRHLQSWTSCLEVDFIYNDGLKIVVRLSLTFQAAEAPQMFDVLQHTLKTNALLANVWKSVSGHLALDWESLSQLPSMQWTLSFVAKSGPSVSFRLSERVVIVVRQCRYSLI